MCTRWTNVRPCVFKKSQQVPEPLVAGIRQHFLSTGLLKKVGEEPCSGLFGTGTGLCCLCTVCCYTVFQILTIRARLALCGELVCQQVANFGSCFLIFCWWLGKNILSGSSVGTQFHGLFFSLLWWQICGIVIIRGWKISVLYSLNTAMLSWGNKHAALEPTCAEYFNVHSWLKCNIQTQLFSLLMRSTFSLAHTIAAWVEMGGVASDSPSYQSRCQCLQL